MQHWKKKKKNPETQFHFHPRRSCVPKILRKFDGIRARRHSNSEKRRHQVKHGEFQVANENTNTKSGTFTPTQVKIRHFVPLPFLDYPFHYIDTTCNSIKRVSDVQVRTFFFSAPLLKLWCASFWTSSTQWISKTTCFSQSITIVSCSQSLGQITLKCRKLLNTNVAAIVSNVIHPWSSHLIWILLDLLPSQTLKMLHLIH